jgi:hypothetical protein
MRAGAWVCSGLRSNDRHCRKELTFDTEHRISPIAYAFLRTVPL